MKEIKVYLSSRCDASTGNGGYGYFINSETYISHKKKTLLKTTMPRMMMRAAIDAMQEVYENIGQCKVILYSNQAVLINSMHYGHCKKFAKYPNKDLVLKSKVASKYLTVYPRSIKNLDCRDINIANELSWLAMNDSTEEEDSRDEGPKPTPLF